MSETQRASFLYHLIIRQSLSKASLWLRHWIPRVASWVAPVVTPLSSHSFYTRFPHVLLFLGSQPYYFSTPLTTDQQQLPSWCSTLISNMLVLFTHTVIIDLLLISVSALDVEVRTWHPAGKFSTSELCSCFIFISRQSHTKMPRQALN